MELTQKLNALFDEWESRYPPYQARTYKRDGIIDEKRFLDQKLKVLFLCKEPNDPNQTPGDFRRWWMKEGLQYKFSHQLAEWAYGILNDFPPHTKAQKHELKLEALRSIAFMNVKKLGGGSTADGAEIWRVAKQTSELLQKQIEIISPDIIVGSIGDWGPWDTIFPHAKWTKDGNDIWIAKSKASKIISFGHPSNRYPHVMNYCLLKNIIHSKEFQSL